MDGRALIDPHTSTAKAVSTVLSLLENGIHIQVTLNCETEVLEVHLPRLKLEFSFRRDVKQLESKQFRGVRGCKPIFRHSDRTGQRARLSGKERLVDKRQPGEQAVQKSSLLRYSQLSDRRAHWPD